jgi:hypothetical protein
MYPKEVKDKQMKFNKNLSLMISELDAQQIKLFIEWKDRPYTQFLQMFGEVFNEKKLKKKKNVCRVLKNESFSNDYFDLVRRKLLVYKYWKRNENSREKDEFLWNKSLEKFTKKGKEERAKRFELNKHVLELFGSKLEAVKCFVNDI